jgi:hypothetical protein
VTALSKDLGHSKVDPEKPRRQNARTLCRNPSDHFWLGLAIRLAKGPIHAPEFRRKYASRACPRSVSR